MRTELHTAYVLHRRRYRETSLILECLSAEHGRVSVVAKGALRRRGSGREAMQPFQKCQVSWSGRAELRTLTKFESAGRPTPLSGERLYSGFYVNELIMRLTGRHDPNTELFRVYESTLSQLASPSAQIEPVLRLFEKAILDTCGYGLQLTADANTGEAIEPAQSYLYMIEEGPVAAGDTAQGVVVHGATLLALAGAMHFDSNSGSEAKRLMRFILHHYIGEKPLASRSLFRQATATQSAS